MKVAGKHDWSGHNDQELADKLREAREIVVSARDELKKRGFDVRLTSKSAQIEKVETKTVTL
ncbi:hypothetical protein [Erythrobacter rubeus]|uniref:Uncharacterized protein n=1 Tax=Erythrobacter rubeus TaxID=2760803 RepID=A0ABR8KPM0_9SPHN|nr:hypothetical protein [Erythrobacter rubeus]MBD2842678.1 hypothetical protein [Erythrobacter rubeus]